MSCEEACPTCARLRLAALLITGERGIEGVTLERLQAETGLPARAVRLHYPTARSCLYDTYEEVAQGIYDDFAEAFAVEPGWRPALRRAGRTLLERITERRAEAQLCFVEVLRGDRELQRRRTASRRRMVDLFVRELGRRRDQPESFRLQLELLVGASFQAIAQVVVDGTVEELASLEPELETRAFVFEPVTE
jgi:AcrR family transcriptional regulator